MGRSRGGFSTKLHAVVDTKGRPIHIALTPGQKTARNYLALVQLACARLWMEEG